MERKERKKSPARKRKPSRSVMKDKVVGKVVVRKKERTLFRGQHGGLYYKTKSGRRYIDKADAKRLMRKKGSPKRRKASPKRRKVHHKKHHKKNALRLRFRPAITH